MTVTVEFLESLFEEIEEASNAKPSHVKKLIEEWDVSRAHLNQEVTGTAVPSGTHAMMCSQAEPYEVTRNIEAILKNGKVVFYIPNDHQIPPEDHEEKQYRADSISTTLMEVNDITDSIIILILSDTMVGVLNYLEEEKHIFHLDEITEEEVATIHHHLDIERIEDKYDAKIENIQPERILQTRRNQATLDNF